MRINNLPNWCIPDSNPAFYDTDSKSVLDQTAKLYGIIKKLVADYNDYAKELDSGMDNFEEEIKKLQSEFEEKIIKLVHDYIHMLDGKLKNQDKVIEDNITYIKNNIGSEVNRIINEMKESGEIEALIADALDGINERLTVLETDVNGLKERLDVLEPTILTNKEDINILNEKMDNFKFKYNESEESLDLMM